MVLKGRLGAIIESIPDCDILTDIGTDHAYIPVYAVQNKICKKAIAADVKEGPVKIAEKNIKQYKLQQDIETRLGYGLEPIEMKEADVIVIAGMGGMLIQEIIEKDLEKAKAAKLMVLQPMNCIEVLRKWLYANGYEIVKELLAEETNKIYNVICARWIGIKMDIDDFHCYIGLKLAERKDSLFKRYAIKKLGLIEKMIDGMKMAEKEAPQLKGLEDIKDKLVLLIKSIS